MVGGPELHGPHIFVTSLCKYASWLRAILGDHSVLKERNQFALGRQKFAFSVAESTGLYLSALLVTRPRLRGVHAVGADRVLREDPLLSPLRVGGGDVFVVPDRSRESPEVPTCPVAL